MTVRKAQPAELPALIGVLARAFDDDPFMAWFCRKDDRRREAVARFMRVGVRVVVAPHAEIYTDDDHGGAAAWVPPGKWRLGFFRQLSFLPDLVRSPTLPRLGEVFGALNRITARHPTTPHWYLFVLGVEPARQGRGIGAELIRPILERCDREQTPAYLEASSPRNVPFYLRHGFRVQAEHQVTGGPPIWLMWRDPRPAT